MGTEMKKSKILSVGLECACREDFAGSMELLEEVMGPDFFREVRAEHLPNILPLLSHIGGQEGVRKAEAGDTVYFVYLKDAATNTTVTSWAMHNRKFDQAAVYESRSAVPASDGTPKKLVIELFRIDSCRNAPSAVSFEELLEVYRKRFKTVDTAALQEIYGRLNWCDVGRYSAAELAGLLHQALKIQHRDHVELACRKTGPDELHISLTRIDCTGKGDLFDRIADIAFFNGFSIRHVRFCMITTQGNPADFDHMPVQLSDIRVVADGGEMGEAQVNRLLDAFRLIDWTEVNDLFQTELVAKGHLDMMDANLMRAVAEFVHSQFSYGDRNGYSLEIVYRYMARYPGLMAELAAAFHAKFNPESPTAGQDFDAAKLAGDIAAVATGITEKDIIIKTIFNAVLNFLVSVRLTNFFSTGKAALAFRLDPAFMDFYGRLFPSYNQAFPAERPYGVFYFYRQEVIGFHVRFDEIARGGWRSVIPKFGASILEKRDNYDYAKNEIFREVFVLAHTQHLKNKDIYEGGAKMITLLKPIENSDFRAYLWENQRAVCAAFLSLINYDGRGRLKDRRIVDTLRSREIIEIGPDENMFDVMIDWMGGYAAGEGYTLGSGLISGKPGSGINHKEYGVTSYGVFQYLLRTALELGIKVEKDDWSIKISGGPYGDVAGNLVKLLNARDDSGNYRFPCLKIVAIVDGPAAAYDPDGLNREALDRMLFTENLDAYPAELLQGAGAYIVYSQPVFVNGNDRYRLVERKGEKLVEQLLLRDAYMRIFQGTLYRQADIFVPCGGRPSTVNISNWQDFCPGGKSSARAIVEGANSFLTPQARTLLQDAGVLIVKDASANKCGVITSSYEILSGLMLDEEEFRRHREEIVDEVMALLKKRADDEAEWLYSHFHKTGIHMTELTEKLSRAINAKNDEIKTYISHHPQVVDDEVIFAHLPPFFRKHYPDRLKRIPFRYLTAIAAVELASRITYKLDGNIGSEIAAVRRS